MNKAELINSAEAMLEESYAPYSNFKVGAALLTKSGKVFTGCNIENSALTPTCCAERVAFFKAISEHEKDFSAIAVVGGKNGEISGICPPCGVCRQVMAEFCDGDFKIYLGKSDKIEEYTLDDILPLSFKGDF